MEKNYIYHIVVNKPTESYIEEKAREGWELCGVPEGVIGRDLYKEGYKVPVSWQYFRKEEIN